MHLTRAIPIALFAVLIGFRADAVSMFTQLDSRNIGEQRLDFTIKADKKGAFVHFVVSVQSKSEALTQFLTADLEVFDGTNQIASCSVQKAQHDKSVVYEFDVSPKYLAKSRFTFGDMAEANGHPMPAGDYYWFYLTDFADEK